MLVMRHSEGDCAILMEMAAPKAYPVPRLARLRVQRAMSQGVLAERSGVGPATIARLEMGKPARLSTIERLAKALGVAPAMLLAQE